MNKKKLILTTTVVLVLTGGFLLWNHRPIPSTVHLDLSGTTGLNVAGTIVVDGAAQEFSGVLPTNITVEARTFHYAILMQDSQGELRGDLTVVGGPSGNSRTIQEYSGVEGHYAHTWQGRSIGLTTVHRKE